MAEELQPAGLCGGANYYWWNDTTPYGTTDADSGGLGDWKQRPHDSVRGGGGGGESLSSEEDESPAPFYNSSPNMNNSCSYINTNALLQTWFEPGQDYFMETRSNELFPFVQQPDADISLSFNNNTPFWNAQSDDIIGESFFPPPTFQQKPYFPVKTKMEEEAQVDSTSMMRKNINNNNIIDQPIPKRTRIETPSPLPTFKVRKEKLGDRITALQQLVSPFGKTDTASVLHEAIDYINFLHDQLTVLSTPYIKNGPPFQQQASCHDHHHKPKMEREFGEEGKQDLRSRGLCLVPISRVANETTADFWTPTFGR